MPKGRTDAALIGLGEYEQAGSSVGDVRTLFLLQVRKDLPQAMESLRGLLPLAGAEEARAMSEWLQSWHFQDDWLQDVVHRTVDEWRRRPFHAKYRQWADAILQGEAVLGPPIAIRWYPTLESVAAFRMRVDDYIKDVERWSEGQGLVKTPTKPLLDRDLAALVQYHVKGGSLDVVRVHHFGLSCDPETSSKALKSLARLIGITLRK